MLPEAVVTVLVMVYVTFRTAVEIKTNVVFAMKPGMLGVIVKPAGVEADQLDVAMVSPLRRGTQLIPDNRTSVGAIGSQTIIYLHPVL